MPYSIEVDGDKIERMRVEQQVMTRDAFAKKVGLSASALWSIEVRPQKTRIGTLRKIAKALGIEPQELLKK